MQPHETLGIAKDASEDEIRKAYKRLAMQWHPDRRPEGLTPDEAHAKFTEIGRAHRVMMRRVKKAQAASDDVPVSTSTSCPKASGASGSSHSKPSTKATQPKASSSETPSSSEGRRPEGNPKAKSPASSTTSADDTKPHASSTASTTGTSSKPMSIPTQHSKSCEPTPSTRSPINSKCAKPEVSEPKNATKPSPDSSFDASSQSTSTGSSFGSSRYSDSASSSGGSAGSSSDSYGSSSRRTTVHEESDDSSYCMVDSGWSFVDLSGISIPNLSSASLAESCSSSRSEKNRRSKRKKVDQHDGSSAVKSTSQQDSCQTGSACASSDPLQQTSSCTRVNPISASSSPRTSIVESDGPEERVVDGTLRPERPLLRNEPSKTWTHVLTMTLEELFHGKTYFFRLVRYSSSGKKEVVPFEVEIPTGCRDGSEVIYPNAGHERKDGSRQDIVFLVKEAKEDRFRRVHDNLILDVRLPWMDALDREKGIVNFRGVDGREMYFEVDYVKRRLLSGSIVIQDAGLPNRDGTGRGKLLIRWEISSPRSGWQTLKQVLRFNTG